MIKALIFDMDGTVVDSETVHYEAWKETLQHHGVASFPFDEFVSYVGASNEKLADDYIRMHNLTAGINTMVKHKQKIYLEMIPAIKRLPGVAMILKTFYQKYRMAVASSSDSVEIESILRTKNIRHCFELIVGGNMVEHKKPDPEIYLKAAHLLGLEPQECIAFEDSESGVVAAKDAGTFVVAVPNKLSANHDFSRADLVVDRIDHVDETMIARFSALTG